MKPSFLRLALLTTTILSTLSGCSSISGLFSSEPVDYQHAKQANPLEVPPDLTAPESDSHYIVKDATWSDYKATRQGNGKTATPGNNPTDSNTSTVQPLPTTGIHLERDGCERWLVVDQPADKVWPALVSWWKDQGYNVVENDPKLGILQTDWKDDDRKLPQDFIHSTLGKVVPGLWSSGEKEAFRTRIERDPAKPDQTEIFVSERVATEVSDNNPVATTEAHWQLAPANPGREAEMLIGIMQQLGGVAPTNAMTEAAAGGASGLAHIAKNTNGATILTDAEPFDRAWRRVGLALDRSGFTVNDRDRAKGVYFVSGAPDDANGNHSSGWFDKLAFWRHVTDNTTQYQVELDENTDGTSTNIHVLDEKGNDAPANLTQRLIQHLYDQMK